jgi:cytoskeletal protein CcmA (bactofilin family)
MFNKPAAFPKGPETQPARASRIGPGSMASGPVSGFSGGPGGASGGPRDSMPGAVPGSLAMPAPTAEADTPVPAEDAAQGSGSRLIVGPNVKLKGAEILDCDTLVVEGRVEATMDSRVIRIAENGAFAGKVGIDVAEIFGAFDGELTARSQLVIHATGRVSGKIRYGKILIEAGGEISGDVQALSASAREQPRAAERSLERIENAVKVA